jgi:hypothetical protein
LNRQIAHWIRSGDLQVAGLNVTEALRGHNLPLFCVLANADGIAPPASVLSAVGVFGAHRVEVLEVGDKQRWFAHADLFVSHHAEERVFRPMSRWLKAQNASVSEPAAPPALQAQKR